MRGKYVFVRGLGDRYSSASLNGLNLPSPEPLRRVVPLDLFPTSIIESSVVQKTYSADMPGEFGGGMVEIKTKAVPLDRIFEFSASTSFNSATSLKDDGLMYDGGENNFGYDDGIRSVQAVFRTLSIATLNLIDRTLVQHNWLTLVEILKIQSFGFYNQERFL